MTKTQAIGEVTRLKGLFPTVTPEQGREWVCVFERYPQPVIEAAVKRHHLAHNHVDNANLMALIEAEHTKATDTLAKKVAEAETIKAAQAVDNQTIAILEDDELAYWHKKALESLKAYPDWMEKADPRTHPFIRGLVLETMKKAARR